MDSIILSSPTRVLFSFGEVEIYVYGVCMALAILFGTIVSNKFANVSNLFPKDIFISIIPWLVFSGLLGARLWYCTLNWHEFSQNYLNILNFRSGGISIHGAILGGFIFLYFYSKLKKIPLINLCDYAVSGLALGQAIGRWGNFFNNEAFGLPTDGFLKLFIPYSSRPYQYQDYMYFHPTFLYESICDFILFLLLFYLTVKKKLCSGMLTFLYLACYSLIRFFIELIRIDCEVKIFNLPFPAIVSLIVFTMALGFIIFKLTKFNK